jgi:hypothetical protein
MKTVWKWTALTTLALICGGCERAVSFYANESTDGSFARAAERECRSYDQYAVKVGEAIVEYGRRKVTYFCKASR